MKCIFVIPRMGGGGAERVLANQANTLADEKNSITIMTIVGGESFYPIDEKVNYISANVKVNRNNRVSLIWSETIGFFKSFLFFRKKIKELKPDFVFSQQRQADIICYFVKKSGIKFKHICYEINDPFVRSYNTKRLLKIIYKNSDMLICQSEAVKKFYINVPNIQVIPNPINPNVIPKRVMPTKNRIVAVGRLDKQKNFSMLLSAFKEVVKAIPDCVLDIYGEGVLRHSLEEQIALLGIQNRAFLRGSHGDVLELIKDATVFAMSSDYEGMPNALLEAMAIGLPVVSTDFKTGVARELIEPGIGIVVPVDDERAFAKALISIIEDKSYLKNAATISPKKMQSLHNDSIMKKWIDAFESVCD